MTTCAMGYQPNNNILLKIIVFAALGAMVVLGTHALKHSLASAVRNCDNRDVKVILKNPITGRKAYVCQPDSNKDEYGRMITEIEDGVEKEVTSFMGSEARKNTLKRVIINLTNQGYKEIVSIDTSIQEVIYLILAGE